MVFLIDPSELMGPQCGGFCPEYDPPSCRPRFLPLYGIDPEPE